MAHLAFFDEVAVVSLTGGGDDALAELRAMATKLGAVSFTQCPAGDRSGAEVFEHWSATRVAQRSAFERADWSGRVPWGPNFMAVASLCTARLMETYAHGLDCFLALGIEAPQTDRLRHVCHITYRAIPHAFRDAGVEMPGELERLAVELESPSGALWRFGPEDAPEQISGTASEFARVGVRRLSIDEAHTLRASGPLAETALGLLKAYL